MREITMCLELQMCERILNVFIYRLYVLRLRVVLNVERDCGARFVARRIFKISIILRELKLDRDKSVSHDR
jgi:hypothetical protein